MKLFSKDASDNTTVKGLVVAKTVELKPTTRGTNFLNLTLSDAEGEVSAKYWNADKLLVIPESGAILRIEGTLGSWNELRQITTSKMEIVDIKTCSPQELEALTPVAPLSGHVYIEGLESLVRRFNDTNDDLNRLAIAVIDENRDALASYPAAKKMHHSVIGGLAWHTYSMATLADKVCDTYDKLYPQYHINRDLVICGILMHDICKIKELEVNALGVCSEYTVEGQLLGHITMGVMYAERMCEKVGVSNEHKLALEHILLSHHGQPDYGSPRMPMFPEALIVSEVDMMDAKFNAMVGTLADVEPGHMSEKCFAAGTTLYRRMGE